MMKRTHAFTRQQMLKMAQGLGHTHPAVWEKETDGKPNGKFIGTCGCGWSSTNRALEVAALEAIVHHALRASETFVDSCQRAGRDPLTEWRRVVLEGNRSEAEGGSPVVGVRRLSA